MEQASGCPTSNLMQFRVVANLCFCTVYASGPLLVCIPAVCSSCAPSEPHSQARFLPCVYYHYRGLKALGASGGRCYSRLLSIEFFWEEKRKMAICCSNLTSVCIGSPRIYGLSAVVAKAQLVSSLGCASVEVRPPLFSVPYPNDSDANYCQPCGTSTGLNLAATATVRVDEAAIQERFKEFHSVMCSNPYQRKKSALELQLSQFLGALSAPRMGTSCTANDINVSYF